MWDFLAFDLRGWEEQQRRLLRVPNRKESRWLKALYKSAHPAEIESRRPVQTDYG